MFPNGHSFQSLVHCRVRPNWSRELTRNGGHRDRHLSMMSAPRCCPRTFDFYLHMRAFAAWFCFLVACPSLLSAQPTQAPYTGIWSIDLRTPAQKREKVECGSANFELTQTGTKIVGDHSFATAGCSRLNEGGEGTVKGIVVGVTAVLVVTSARNGQIVLGSATVQADSLHWQVSEEIKAGEPDGDSGLILHSGVLQSESPRTRSLSK